jgi:hypothetical protein
VSEREKERDRQTDRERVARSIGNSAKNLGPLWIDKWEKNNNGFELIAFFFNHEPSFT